MVKSIFDMSTPEKLNKFSIFVPRGDSYIAFDNTSEVEAITLSAIDFGYYGLFNLKRSELVKFNKKRGLYFKNMPPLIDGKRSYYDGRQGIIHVLSMEKLKNKNRDPYHRVIVKDLVYRDEDDDKKIESWKKFVLDCPCGRVYQRTCRVPIEWSKFYGDKRISYELPAPSVYHFVDRHGFLAGIWLHIFHEVEGFGILDITREEIEEIEKIVKRQNRKKERLENYILNPLLMRTKLIDPYGEWIWKSYRLDLSTMIY